MSSSHLDSCSLASCHVELGPLTLGFDERWADLAPSEFRLQSFGHVSVDEEGTMTIKLIGIDGEVRLEKTLSPEQQGEGGGGSAGSASASSAALSLFVLFASMLVL